MKYYSESITNLIEELASLPNIGPKSAQRLALHILNLPEARVKHLADSILTAKQKICFCKECFNLSDRELCQVCADEKRDHQTIMVVEEPSDLAAYEKTGQELLQRLQREDIKEVIIATNSTVEGEATALWISKYVKQAGIKVTRIASGVPVGGALEFIDEMTLFRALEGRTEL